MSSCIWSLNNILGLERLEKRIIHNRFEPCKARHNHAVWIQECEISPDFMAWNINDLKHRSDTFRREMPAAKVMYAEDGIDASAKLGGFAPDLILADIMMPKMDGAEFIHYVRKNERYSKTKIIAITGLHKEDPHVAAVKDAGAEKIMFKPWCNEELILTIKDILGA